MSLPNDSTPENVDSIRHDSTRQCGGLGAMRPANRKWKGEVAAVDQKRTSQGRHEYRCTICTHTETDEIEQAFVNWISPDRIAKHYGVSRDAVYRHAHALGLMEKRRRNVRSALERIIEKAGEVEVSASAVVSAVAAYAKINAAGQWVERSERVNLNELFGRMTPDEMEAYATDGTLPAWFQHTVGSTESLSATALDSHGGVND